MVSKASLNKAIEKWVSDQNTGNLSFEEAEKVVEALMKEYGDIYLDMTADELKEEFETETVVDALYEAIETLQIDFAHGRYSNWGKAGSFMDRTLEMNFILNEDEAIKIAEDLVRQDLEYEPELFNQDWLMWHIDEDRAESMFREMYDEWNRSYARGIADEGDSEYGNRLIREMVEMGVVDEDDVFDEDGELKDDFDYEDYIDDFVEKLTQDQIDEGDGGFEHYKYNFGDEMAVELFKDWNLIDIDEASEDAVSTDGWAHFVSLYDGGYEVIGNGVVVFRE